MMIQSKGNALMQPKQSRGWNKTKQQTKDAKKNRQLDLLWLGFRLREPTNYEYNFILRRIFMANEPQFGGWAPILFLKDINQLLTMLTIYYLDRWQLKIEAEIILIEEHKNMETISRSYF